MINTTAIKIPKKYQALLTEVTHDSDGYWAYCVDGYEFSEMGCQTAHEDTQKDLMRVIRSLVAVEEAEIIDDGKLSFNQWLKKYHELEEKDITEEYYMKRDCVDFEEAKGLVDNMNDAYGDYLEGRGQWKREESPEVVAVEEVPAEPTRKVWILEKWISREYMLIQHEQFKNGVEIGKETNNTALIRAMQETVDMYARNLEKYPDGYWLGWGGKVVYRDFKAEAIENIKGHRRVDKSDCTFRVVTAMIPESAKTWVGYKNPVEDKESLQDLYTTIEQGGSV